MNDLSVIEAEFGDLSKYRNAPDFWIVKAEHGERALKSLKPAAVRTIGKSAGGRDIIAIEYGEKEPLDVTTSNLHSALAAKIVPPDPTEIFPPAFYGSTRRMKPVVALQGAIHGEELTGTAAIFNLCRIIETGQDFRGKPWPRLAELARETRLAMVPWMNPDGTARSPINNPSGAPLALCSRCSQGVANDGTKYKYPEVKNIFPIPPDKTAFMGTYYNDAGVNLQYDLLSVQRQPETIAWMKYYLDERPDGVVIWHCNAGSMLGPPEAYVPEGFQHELSRLAGAVRRRLFLEGYETGRLSWAGLVSMGKPFVNQMNGVYMVCGAMPIMCELPCGYDLRPFTCEQLLDIGLLTIEEILFYAHTDGLRPYEVWSKVKERLLKEKKP